MLYKKTSVQGMRYALEQSMRKWSCVFPLMLSSFLFNVHSMLANSPVPGGNFESPDLQFGTFEYQPDGTPWSFIGGSGISDNSSGFTNGNPPAPEGSQVLFLQKTGSVTQTLNLAAGDYSFSFKAAQRGNFNHGGQTFTLKIDGVLIGTYTPGGIFYQNFQTPSISLSSGSHTLQLKGTNPTGGDNTAFVDDMTYEAAKLWSDPLTWPGGVLPGINSAVVIPSGETIILDINANIKNLSVNGTLLADQTKDLNLSTNWILVEGSGSLLRWGTESAPYLKRAVITLKHAPGDIVSGPTMKFLAARNGGQVEIHGENKMGWTQLNVTANKNDNTITLKENPSWEVGDKIVIASTDFATEQAEVRTITSVSNGGLTLGLDAGLTYMHWGELLHYDSGNHILDERAEVALLSRNITIQGDAASETDGIGGHTMFMPNSKVQFSGVELYRMGQRDSLARYPFHWHFAGNVSGQYIKNCSIHRSYNRVVTVHGTNYALVEDNVGYDHIGHGYFLEDGNEIRNTFRKNLGIFTRAPAIGTGTTPHDRVEDSSTGLLKLPATFWITNPENYFIGNVAAGSEGSGFWMVVQDSTLGQAPQINPAPGKRDLLQFEDNKAHSNSFSNFSIDGRIVRATNEFRNGHYAPYNPDGSQIIPQVTGFTGYKTRQRNIWLRTNTMEFWNCSLADSPRNTFFAFNQILYNSLLVGKSPNIGNPVTSNELDAGRSLGLPNRHPNSVSNIFSGHTIYDGPSAVVNVHLADFYGSNAAAFKTNGAALKSPVHWAEGITFENVEEDRKVKFRNQSWLETMYSSGLIDMDGSITGIAGAHITPRIAPHSFIPDTKIREEGFNVEPGAILKSDWFAYLNTSERFGLLKIHNGWSTAEKHPTYNIRSDGPATYGEQAPNQHNVNPVILNDPNLKYYWQYHKFPNLARPQLLFVNQNDYMISAFPNMPSSTYVYKNSTGTIPLEQATSLAQLISSPTQKYFFEDNTIYVKHIASEIGDSGQFGDRFKYVSPQIRICQEQNCTSQFGNTEDVTFADFEMGIDGRIVATSSGNLPTPQVSLNTTNPNDAGISWTMVNDGDGIDEHTQVRFDIPRQVWTDFESLIVNLTGVNRFKVHIRDDSDGVISMGTFNAGNEVVIPLRPEVNIDRLDEVVRLIFRIKESHLGSIASTINLFDIKLSLMEPPNSGGSVLSNRHEEFATTAISGDLSVYPNPASDLINLALAIERADDIMLEIFDLTGRKCGIYQQQVAKGAWQYTLNRKQFGLKSGVYQLRIQTKFHGTKTAKLTILDQ